MFDDLEVLNEEVKRNSPSPPPRQNFRRKKYYEKRVRYVDDDGGIDGMCIKKSMGR